MSELRICIPGSEITSGSKTSSTRTTFEWKNTSRDKRKDSSRDSASLKKIYKSPTRRSVYSRILSRPLRLDSQITSMTSTSI